MRDILQTEFAITTDADTLVHHPEAKLCYAPQPIASVDAIFLKSTHLLFETMIGEQECRYFDFNGTPAIFPVFHKDSALPFDPLAAIFYMLSRYEEYLPHRKDQHGRILITETLAYKNGFHLTPVVERWALMIKDLILEHYPETVFLKRNFSFEPTIDIDSAYCYLHKGWFRTCMGILRDGIHRRDPAEVKHRIRVLKKKEEDPYDTFDYIINLNKQYRFPLIFFALLGDYSLHDKPISYLNNEFRQLLQHLGDYAKIGIHCSYYSTDEPDRIVRETQRLSEILHRPIVRNRFHFLRFNLPGAYRNLVRAGVTHDYSMGYADLPGFRNGTCSIVPFFDLSSDQESDLSMHPFMTMDTTFHTHMKLSPKQATEKYHALVDEVEAVGGTFSCIFHNQNLCEEFGWEGWREVYEDLLEYVAEKLK
jgi:hypothetical protein